LWPSRLLSPFPPCAPPVVLRAPIPSRRAYRAACSPRACGDDCARLRASQFIRQVVRTARKSDIAATRGIFAASLTRRLIRSRVSKGSKSRFSSMFTMQNFTPASSRISAPTQPCRPHAPAALFVPFMQAVRRSAKPTCTPQCTRCNYADRQSRRTPARAGVRLARDTPANPHGATVARALSSVTLHMHLNPDTQISRCP